jgi:hypothetical protein
MQQPQTRHHIPYAQLLSKLTGFYTQRNDAVFDKLEEVIRILKKPTGEKFQNKKVKIEG